MSNVINELLDLVENSVNYSHGKVIITDKKVFQENISRWVEVSSLETGSRQGWSRYLVRLAAIELGIFPASINELYLARGRDEVPHTFTVPAMNMRVLSFDAARAAFKAASSVGSNAIIFEIARSEMG